MFSPDAFSSNSFYGGTPSAPSVSAGYDGFDAAQISQNIAMAQALQQEAGALSQPKASTMRATRPKASTMRATPRPRPKTLTLCETRRVDASTLTL
jgi:hypothetical protein